MNGAHVDEWRTDPPQTVPGPHDRMRYFGLSGGTECVSCMDCEKVIPFTHAAEHQATHAPTDEDDIAETITRRDFEESVAAFRGLAWGLLGSVVILACAVVIVGTVAAVIAAIVTGVTS